MKKMISVFLLLFIVTVTVAQNKGIVQGIVLDKEANSEPLAFANITIKNSQIAVSTDIAGMYNVNLDSGTYSFVFGFVGYQKIEVPNIIVKSGEVTTLNNIILKGLQLKTIALNTQKESVLVLLSDN